MLPLVSSGALYPNLCTNLSNGGLKNFPAKSHDSAILMARATAEPTIATGVSYMAPANISNGETGVQKIGRTAIAAKNGIGPKSIIQSIPA